MIYLLMDTEDRGPSANLIYGIVALLVLAPLGYFMTGQGMKTAYWLGLGALILAWFIFLITSGGKYKPQVFLFWSFCVTLAVSMLAAMGIDFLYLISFQHLAAGESFKKHMFEATFVSPSTLIVLISWAAVVFLFVIIWFQGMRLKGFLKQYMPPLNQLDDVTYRMIAIGWPLLTGGIITGAVWANSAWGTYWGWDPKETWSLITWFIYAIYLHARYVRGWKGSQMAVISAVGFLAVIFTYLGVNLVLSGLHSYGGMK
ncbi:MAG TPA: cytochrome c biogenesis protein CcsA [Nitrospirota bacterium]|nr:cytochrome c biogenesis protein CcsA [Nitrospirota bacterium]